eukprot:6211760-Pleurochrysis_carterae.AAC.5
MKRRWVVFRSEASYLEHELVLEQGLSRPSPLKGLLPHRIERLLDDVARLAHGTDAQLDVGVGEAVLVGRLEARAANERHGQLQVLCVLAGLAHDPDGVRRRRQLVARRLLIVRVQHAVLDVLGKLERVGGEALGL